MHLKSIMFGVCALMSLSVMAKRPPRKATIMPVKVPVSKLKPVDGKIFSYALAVSQGGSLKNYLMQREGVDSLNMKDAAKALMSNLSEKDAAKVIATAAGLKIAEMNKKMLLPQFNMEATGKKDTVYVNLEVLNRALGQMLLGEKMDMTADSARKIIDAQMKYQAEVYKYANQEWLLNNAKQKGVKTTKSGLQYKILTKGTGPVASDTSNVEVNYEGKLINGTVFDSSYKRGQSVTFRPTQVIKGWKEALTMMPEGSVWELYIPASLGYGDRANQAIPANSTLIFKVELIKANKPTAKGKR